MKLILLPALLALCHQTTTQEAFCYDAASCGPTSSAWSGVCQSGKRQSPIVLPALSTFSLTGHSIKLGNYRSNSFRMVNTGHAVQVDFNGYSPQVTLPDPGLGLGQTRTYKFASAHFHWGRTDTTVGSEHCVGVKCGNMEMHLVHYLASYPSQAAAVASGDPNALAVIGVLIDYTVGELMAPISLMNPFKPAGAAGTGPLAPIVNNLRSVEHADHTGTEYHTVNQPLDLSKLLYETGVPGISMEMFTYKGSLTTPGCNEQVNWYVMKNPARTSKYNLQQFRSIPRDGANRNLFENHRPVQPLNGRVVNKFKVLP